MNKITTLFLAILLVSGFVLAEAQSKVQAAKSFTGIIPFMTSSDRLGFFDQNTGRVYMYDNNFTNCVFSGQLQTLGKPIQALTKVSAQ